MIREAISSINEGTKLQIDYLPSLINDIESSTKFQVLEISEWLSDAYITLALDGFSSVVIIIADGYFATSMSDKGLDFSAVHKYMLDADTFYDWTNRIDSKSRFFGISRRINDIKKFEKFVIKKLKTKSKLIRDINHIRAKIIDKIDEQEKLLYSWWASDIKDMYIVGEYNFKTYMEITPKTIKEWASIEDKIRAEFRKLGYKDDVKFNSSNSKYEKVGVYIYAPNFNYWDIFVDADIRQYEDLRGNIQLDESYLVQVFDLHIRKQIEMDKAYKNFNSTLKKMNKILIKLGDDDD